MSRRISIGLVIVQITAMFRPSHNSHRSRLSRVVLLVLFFLRFSSISLHCHPTRFLLPFSCTSRCCWYLLMLLFISLYFSCRSDSNVLFLSSLLLLHRSRISTVTQGCFFGRCLPRISLAVSVTAMSKVVIIEFTCVSSVFMIVRGHIFCLP